jgi:hypothetical protein
MTDKELTELRINSMLNELSAQRNAALDKCAGMAGEIAVLKARLVELEKPQDSGQSLP